MSTSFAIQCVGVSLTPDLNMQRQQATTRLREGDGYYDPRRLARRSLAKECCAHTPGGCLQADRRGYRSGLCHLVYFLGLGELPFSG
jgi:hypothetical protein